MALAAGPGVNRRRCETAWPTLYTVHTQEPLFTAKADTLRGETAEPKCGCTTRSRSREVGAHAQRVSMSTQRVLARGAPVALIVRFKTLFHSKEQLVRRVVSTPEHAAPAMCWGGARALSRRWSWGPRL
eukprot:6347584-Prymnesium_polylepis.1